MFIHDASQVSIMKFTQEEINFIKANYSTMTIKEIATILNKDPRRVSDIAISLGLRKYLKRGTKIYKKCEYCGKTFYKGYRESRSHFATRRFCSQECFRKYMKEHRNTFPSNIRQLSLNGKKAEKEALKYLKNQYDFIAKSVSVCDYIGIKDGKVDFIEVKYGDAKLTSTEKKASKILGKRYKIFRIT